MHVIFSLILAVISCSTFFFLIHFQCTLHCYVGPQVKPALVSCTSGRLYSPASCHPSGNHMLPQQTHTAANKQWIHFSASQRSRLKFNISFSDIWACCRTVTADLHTLTNTCSSNHFQFSLNTITGLSLLVHFPLQSWFITESPLPSTSLFNFTSVVMFLYVTNLIKTNVKQLSD